MKKLLLLIQTLLSCYLAVKIPIQNVPITYPAFHTMKARLMNSTLMRTNGFGDQMPVKDYMNTQYFIEV